LHTTLGTTLDAASAVLGASATSGMADDDIRVDGGDCFGWVATGPGTEPGVSPAAQATQPKSNKAVVARRIGNIMHSWWGVTRQVLVGKVTP
jgi:hypothetical protein